MPASMRRKESKTLGKLAKPSVVAEVLERHNIRLAKGLGQHFLIDGNALRRIIELSDLAKDDSALEIGPGIGTLTEELCECAGRVVAVEMDRRLVAALRDTVGDRKNLLIVQGDAMRIDLSSLFATEENVKLVSNLPYNVATPLLLRALLELPQLGTITVTVQRELADRYLAAPATPAYGAVTVKLHMLTSAKRIARLPPSVFFPPPKVESSILHFVRKQTDLDRPRIEDFFAFLNAAFSSRRKKLINALSGGREAMMPRAIAEAAVREAGIDPSRRAEELSSDQLFRVFSAIGRDRAEIIQRSRHTKPPA
jgi:16S rRNA (adenine1518-N6/adenine1519-N6)-dimethyltransferase